MKKYLFFTVLILIMFIFVFLYFFKDQKINKNNNIFNVVDIKNIVFTLDGLSNTIYFFDTTNSKFLENSFQIDNPKYYESSSLALAPNGNLYVPMSPRMDLNGSKAEAYIAVIDVRQPHIIQKITSDLWPQQIIIAPNGKAYFTHSFMYEDGSGWAISVLDTNTNKIIRQLKIPGAPGTQKLLEDNQIYIPVMGGGKEHFGNSNLLIINTENDEFTKYYPEDFSALPPQDIALYNNEPLSLFYAVKNADGIKPDLIKLNNFTDSNYKKYFATKNKSNNIILREIPINLHGSVQFIIYNSLAFISYFDSISGQGGGLMIYNIENDQIIKDIDLQDRTFIKSMVLFNNKIYITDPTHKAISVVDPNTYEINSITLPNNAYPTNISSY